MGPRDWVVALIEPNKFEAQIVIDLLRAAGCQRVKRYGDSAEAMKELTYYPANIILMEIESAPIDGVEWTKQFRRDQRMHNRKAAVFITSHAVSRSQAEACRHGGANAIIGKPLSGRTLVGVIEKVLKNPRPFIDAAGYVGPCRRAGIVTAGPARKRRRSDAEIAAERAGPSLSVAVQTLSATAEDVLKGRNASAAVLLAALEPVKAHAAQLEDSPLIHACAALGMLLGDAAVAPAAHEALKTATQGIAKLANSPGDASPARQGLAQAVSDAVESALAKRAA